MTNIRDATEKQLRARQERLVALTRTLDIGRVAGLSPSDFGALVQVLTKLARQVDIGELDRLDKEEGEYD